jgi:hypothetical protein
MKLPPWHNHARQVGQAGGERGEAGRREAGRWQRMREYSGRVVAALTGARVIETEDRGQTDSGAQRVAVTGVQLGDGSIVHVPDARGLREDWAADPETTVGRLAHCAEVWPVRPTAAGWKASPHTCGVGICPLCASLRVAEKRALWTGSLQALAEQGYHVVLMTRTRRVVDGDAPVVWTEADRARWGPCPHETHDDATTHPGADEDAAHMSAPEALAHLALGVGYPVPGETLGSAWDDLSAGWRSVLDGRDVVDWQGRRLARRTWWARTVVAQVDAMEATQVRTDGDGRAAAVRWNVHAHTILVLDPTALDLDRDTEVIQVPSQHADRPDRTVRRVRGDAAWWRVWLSGWLGVVDAEEAPQDARVISARGNPGEMAAAIREVVKYAGKLSDMTDAGIIEWLATTKGRRPHRAGGTMHGGTRRGRVARALDLQARVAAAEEVAEGPGDEELVELREALTHTVTCGGWDAAAAAEAGTSVEDVGAGVQWLRERLTAWERQHADDVGRALAETQLELERRGAATRAQGDVYDPPRPELREVGTAWHLLTVDRLRLLLREGLHVVHELRLCGSWGPTLGRVDLREVRRQVQAWDPQAREGPA